MIEDAQREENELLGEPRTGKSRAYNGLIAKQRDRSISVGGYNAFYVLP